jgi:hypothetical protein
MLLPEAILLSDESSEVFRIVAGLLLFAPVPTLTHHDDYNSARPRISAKEAEAHPHRRARRGTGLEMLRV